MEKPMVRLFYLSEIMILLKLISVLGDQLSVQLAQFCNNSEEADFSVQSLLKELENRDLLEYLYDLDQNDMVFRFTYPFCSQTLRTLQVFQDQRQHAHNQVINFMQKNSFFNQLTKFSYFVEEQLLLQHILLAQQVQDEAELTIKAKQGLIVKRINNRFLKKENVIKTGQLSKKEKKGPKQRSFEDKFVVITSQEVCWYLDQKTFTMQKPSISSIQLSELKCAVYNQQVHSIPEGVAFKVWSSEKEDKTAGKAVFVCQSADECNEWLAYLDYMRTVTQVKQFSNQYFAPQFPQFKQDQGQTKQRKEFNIVSVQGFGAGLTKSARDGDASLDLNKGGHLSFHKGDRANKLKAQVEQLYKIVAGQFVGHILDVSLKPSPPEDAFKCLFEYDQRNTHSMMQDVFSNESEIHGESSEFSQEEEEIEQQNDEDLEEGASEMQQEQNNNKPNSNINRKSAPRLTIDQEAAYRLFGSGINTGIFLDIKETDTPEMGIQKDQRVFKNNNYFYSNLKQPRYWEEDRQFNSYQIPVLEGQLAEGDVAFTVQSQTLDNKFQSNIDQSAFYTLGKESERSNASPSKYASRKESLSEVIRKLRNLSVTQQEKQISPDYAWQVLKILEQAQKNFVPKVEFIQTPAGSVHDLRNHSKNYSIYSQDILQSAPVLQTRNNKQLGTPVANGRKPTNYNISVNETSEYDKQSYLLQRREERMMMTGSKSVQDKFNAFFGHVPPVISIKRKKFNIESQDDKPISKAGDSRLTSIMDEQSSEGESRNYTSNFAADVVDIAANSPESRSPEESCNVENSLEESMAIVAASGCDLVSVINPEQDLKMAKSQQVLLSNFSNHKRVSVSPLPARQSHGQTRILQLSQDTQAVILAPSQQSNESMLVRKGTRVFVEKYLPEKNLVQAAFLLDGVKIQVLCSIEEGEQERMYQSVQEKGGEGVEGDERGFDSVRDLKHSEHQISDTSPARTSKQLTKMQLRLEKKKLVKRQKEFEEVVTPKIASPKIQSRKRNKQK